MTRVTVDVHIHKADTVIVQFATFIFGFQAHLKLTIKLNFHLSFPFHHLLSPCLTFLGPPFFCIIIGPK